jgi:hypothetical protein
MEAAFIDNINTDVEAIGRDILEANRLGSQKQAKAVGEQVARQASQGAPRSNVPAQTETPATATPTDFVKLSPADRAKELRDMEKKLGVKKA